MAKKKKGYKEYREDDAVYAAQVTVEMGMVLALTQSMFSSSQAMSQLWINSTEHQHRCALDGLDDGTGGYGGNGGSGSNDGELAEAIALLAKAINNQTKISQAATTNAFNFASKNLPPLAVT